MDVAYARGWSLGLDLRLLCRTPLAAPAGSEDGDGDERRRPLASRVRVAVVGLGYWGPNLVRNLARARRTPSSSRVCDLRRGRARRRSRGATRPSRRTTEFDEVLADDDVEAVAIATPVSTHHALALRALDAGKHVFVEKPLAASSAEALELDRARRRARPRADARPHVPLQPAGQHDPRADRRGRARRHLLHLDEPREPRPAPARRQRRLGSRPARLLDPPLLARRDARRHVSAMSRGCVDPGHRRTSRSSTSSSRRARSRTSSSSWLAPSKLRRTTIVGSREDGRLRRHEQRAGARLRLGRRCCPNPETFGEYQLTYRTGDIVSPHVAAAEPLFLELSDFCTAIRTGEEPRFVRRDRPRRRPDDRGRRRVARGRRRPRGRRRGHGRTHVSHGHTGNDHPSSVPRSRGDSQRPQGRPARGVLRPDRHGAFINGPQVREFEEAFADYVGAHRGRRRRQRPRRAAARRCSRWASSRATRWSSRRTRSSRRSRPSRRRAERRCSVDVSETDYEHRRRLRRGRDRPSERASCAGAPLRAAGRHARARRRSPTAHGLTDRRGRLPGARRRRATASRAGALGVAAAFSFYPAKNLGAFGDAGALVDGRRALRGRVRALREHGQRAKYEHEPRATRRGSTRSRRSCSRTSCRCSTAGTRSAARPPRSTPRRSRASATSTAARRRRTATRLAPLRRPDGTTRRRSPRSCATRGIGDRPPLPGAGAPVAGVPQPRLPARRVPGRRGGSPRDVLSLPMFPGITERQLEAVVDARPRVLRRG